MHRPSAAVGQGIRGTLATPPPASATTASSASDNTPQPLGFNVADVLTHHTAETEGFGSLNALRRYFLSREAPST